jgi:hypothetical protein
MGFLRFAELRLRSAKENLAKILLETEWYEPEVVSSMLPVEQQIS